MNYSITKNGWDNNKLLTRKADKNGVSSATASLLGRIKINWSEILWEHAEEFFGEEDVCGVCGDIWEKPCWCDRHEGLGAIPKCDYIARQILTLLQKKKYEEADLYFRNACILIKSK